MAKKKKRYPQTGSSIKEIDRMFDAKKPGWRISKTGKPYFENRRNRSDVRKHL